jgi:hypothetical protein
VEWIPVRLKRPSNLSRRVEIQWPRSIEPLAVAHIAYKTLGFRVLNPRSSEYYSLCLGKLTPEPLHSLENDAQSRTRLKCINELVNVFLIQKQFLELS